MLSLGTSLGRSLGISLGNSLSTPVLPFGALTFARASSGYAINPVTGEVTGPYASGTPIVVSGSGKRVLRSFVSATGVVTYNYAIGSWTLSAGLTVDDNAAVPPWGGAAVVDRVKNGTAGGNRHAEIATTIAAGTACAYALIKNDETVPADCTAIRVAGLEVLFTWATKAVSVPTGYAGTVGVQALNDGYYLIYVYGTITDDPVFYFIPSTSDGIDGSETVGSVYMIAAQIVAGSYPKGIILTAADAVVTVKEDSYFAASSVPLALRDKGSVDLYPGWSNAQQTAEKTILEFADTTQNIRLYYDGADKKVKIGGRITEILTTQTVKYYFAVDSVNAYWQNDSTDKVYKCPLTGGTPTELATGRDGQGVAVDSTYVYYADTATGNIYRAPIAVGAEELLCTSTSGSIRGFYVDDTHVYWCNATYGSIYRVAKAGGSASAVVTGETGNVGICGDANNIYWACPSATRIADKATFTKSDLYTGFTNSLSVATDGVNVYIADHTVGAIYYGSVAGGALTTVVSGLTNPRGLCVRDSTIMWTRTDGAMVRIYFKAPFASGATTHSAQQKLTVSWDRVAGTITLAGFTTGNGVVTGTSWSRPNGNLYYLNDSALATQIDGYGSEPVL